MKAEIEKVLTMVQEGKIDSEKASELIEVLKQKDTEKHVINKSSKYADKMLKIQVKSSVDDNVNVNLPIKLVKVVLLAGHNIASSIPQSEKYVKNIDVDLIIEAIENELDGQIIDVRSADGDTVSVRIE
ncbi:SHOCT-like domain-containing protein [Heyndrickxia acidicola]|uniref:YvlB/LiaX N-terminal domain-containing protein n=1 Tax=Heyndrickxia acidicola TaxID=209389 RepID=A0ABU6MB82_9BACI|nr:hypothetical protein [Heyndrickxia acidicola]MED1201684.1 hypothetical protein [Heyndrickxia acidicola]